MRGVLAFGCGVPHRLVELHDAEPRDPGRALWIAELVGQASGGGTRPKLVVDLPDDGGNSPFCAAEHRMTHGCGTRVSFKSRMHCLGL